MIRYAKTTAICGAHGPSPIAPPTYAQAAPKQTRATVKAAETAKEPEQAETPERAETPKRAETPEQVPATRPRIVVPTGNFALQIAARPDEAEAKKIAAQIQDAGGRARVVRAELPNRGTWYRVYVGAFETRAEAENYGAQLKRDGTIAEFLIADLRPR